MRIKNVLNGGPKHKSYIINIKNESTYIPWFQ